jgi:hypothetical protein
LCFNLKLNNSCKSLIISYPMIGSNGSSLRKLSRFLRLNSADRIYFVGGLIDYDALRQDKSALVKVMQFLSLLTELKERYGTKVIGIQHDLGVLHSNLKPLLKNSIQFQEYDIIDHAKRILLVDYALHQWLKSSIASWLSNSPGGIQFVYSMKSVFKKLSTTSHQSVDSFVHWIDSQELIKIEKRLLNFSGRLGFEMVITGLPRTAEVGGSSQVKLLNAGLWCTDFSALSEDEHEEWSVIYYNESDQMEKSHHKQVGDQV